MNDTFYYLENEVLKYPTKNFELIEAVFRNTSKYIGCPSDYSEYQLAFPGVIPLAWYVRDGTFTKAMAGMLPTQIFQAGCEWYRLTGKIIALIPSIFFDTQKNHFVLIPAFTLDVCQSSFEEAKNLYMIELSNFYTRNRMILDITILKDSTPSQNLFAKRQVNMKVCLLQPDAEQIAFLIEMAVRENFTLITTLNILDLYLRCVVSRSELSRVPGCSKLFETLTRLLKNQDITDEDIQILDIIGYDMLYSQSQRQSLDGLKIFYLENLSTLVLTDYFIENESYSPQVPSKITFSDFLRMALN